MIVLEIIGIAVLLAAAGYAGKLSGRAVRHLLARKKGSTRHG